MNEKLLYIDRLIAHELDFEIKNERKKNKWEFMKSVYRIGL